MSRKKGSEVSVRKRGPWKPEKGQYIRPYGTRLAIPERAGFALVLIAAVIILIIVLA